MKAAELLRLAADDLPPGARAVVVAWLDGRTDAPELGQLDPLDLGALRQTMSLHRILTEHGEAAARLDPRDEINDVLRLLIRLANAYMVARFGRMH